MTPEQEFFLRFFGLPLLTMEHQREEPEVHERKKPQGIGPGVIITGDGYILTNDHVVSDGRGNDADEILVRLKDGR